MLLSKSRENVFNTMRDSLGRKKAKESPRLFNARSLQRPRTREGVQGPPHKPACKCISGTKGQCSFQGGEQRWFPAFSLSHSDHANKQTYTSPGRKALIQRGLQEFDYWGGVLHGTCLASGPPMYRSASRALLMAAPDR